MRTENERKIVSRIRDKYQDNGESKTEKLKRLDRKAKLPAEVFAYAFGIVGTLVIGIGMCLSMKIIGNLLPLGIVIGCLGIAMVSVNHLIYKKIEKHRKKKYTDKILQLSDELLAE